MKRRGTHTLWRDERLLLLYIEEASSFTALFFLERRKTPPVRRGENVSLQRGDEVDSFPLKIRKRVYLFSLLIEKANSVSVQRREWLPIL